MKNILITTLITTLIFTIGSSLYAGDFENRLNACNRGSGYDCTLVALYYESEETGEGPRKNKSKAFEYYKKSCDVKYPLGCSVAADYYERGIGTEVNIKEAIRINKFLCDHGYSSYATTECKELTKY